jgi:hypothetical protein
LAVVLALERANTARASFDRTQTPTLTASASTGQSQTTRATVDANGNILPIAGTRSDDDNARLSLSQKIPLGATITVDLEQARATEKRMEEVKRLLEGQDPAAAPATSHPISQKRGT